MRQSIQLKLGQNLTMTPQLQQAIRLLQLSSMELGAEIQDALESNMMLEVEEGNEDAADGFNGEAYGGGEDDDFVAANEVGGGDPNDADAKATTDEIPQDLPVDSDWGEIYDTLAPSGNGVQMREAPTREFESASTIGESLSEHLHWQLNLMSMSQRDRAIAFAIVDALDKNGYLSTTLEDLLETLIKHAEIDIELDEVEAVLKHVQSLEPTGVASRDLRECLLLQLLQVAPGTLWLEQARRCCADYIDLLGARDFTQLMRRLRVSKEELSGIVTLIQSMNPRPGAQFSAEQPEYIVPDVFVRKHKGRWRVELNGDAVPAIRVNPYYAGMIKRADNSSDNTSLKSHLQEARWFIKSLQSRSETLLRVATAIVGRQRAFLEYGEEAMKPLVLHDIAETLEMHESTISRVTTRKYMHTPRGIYELKYFFSSHVSTTLGGEASSTAIRAVMKKMIASENAEKPLSDNKIATLLSQKGIQVARRTVAKYREAMAIPPSNERKRLA